MTKEHNLNSAGLPIIFTDKIDNGTVQSAVNDIRLQIRISKLGGQGSGRGKYPLAEIVLWEI